MERFTVVGNVVEGEQLGRKLGFPTANIALPEGSEVPVGVYAAKVLVDGHSYQAVGNVGVRPTVTRQSSVRVELYLFDFEGDLYGKELTVHFCQRLRDEIRFASLEALQQQIAQDSERARAYFLHEK